jgi:hypothetical protein
MVETVISPRHSVRLSELIGLSPADAQQKLTGLPTTWPTPMALEVKSPDGVHGFVDLHAFLQDRGAGEIEVRALGHSDQTLTGFSQCRAGYADERAADHRFVTVHPSADPSYVLLEIDLGAYPSRNLTYFHGAGLVGVRNDHVVWRMRPDMRGGAGLAREPALPPPPRPGSPA